MIQKKALMLASVASMIDQFNIPNISLLQSLGYEVDVVADFKNPGTITKERAEDLTKRLTGMNVRVIDIPIPRSINLHTIFFAYKNVKKLVAKEHYNLIHCHSPIGGAICRLAAKKERKRGMRVIYTAHGFHFYKGASTKNWIVFYPVEKLLSRITDVLITINTEDYKRAKKSFKAKETIYVPGVGVNTEKVEAYYRRDEIRKALGIEKNQIVLLSVGELNKNKNHETVIRALSKLENKACYIIVGKGEKEEYLNNLINQLKLSDHVKLVGFRNDVADFYIAADVFVFPSFREGLSVSLMEAMVNSLPVVCSRIRGNIDLIDEGRGGFLFDPTSEDDVENSIQKIFESDYKAFGKYNYQKVKAFDEKKIGELMVQIYKGVRINSE